MEIFEFLIKGEWASSTSFSKGENGWFFAETSRSGQLGKSGICQMYCNKSDYGLTSSYLNSTKICHVAFCHQKLQEN